MNLDPLNLEITAKDLTEVAFKAVAEHVANLVGSLGGITDVASLVVNSLGKIGLAAQGIEAVGKSAAAMGSALISGNAALEMTTISFKTLLGSSSAANDMIKQLTSFAAATPFELAGLEKSTQKLLAFGYKSQEIIPLMTSMGDAISALGGTQENLDSLVYVMGQMHSEAHLNAGDIMQMTNLGIPALKMLADHYKVTTGQMQEMISKGLVPGTEAVQVFKDGMEKQYGGMMVAQSATFSGMMSNLHDWAAATTITLTKPFFEPAKAGLQKLLDFVQSPAGVEAVNKLAGYIQEGVDKLTALFIKALPSIIVFKDKVIELAEHLYTKLAPAVEALLPKLGAIAMTAIKLYETFSPLAIAFRMLEGFLTGGVSGAAASFADSLGNIFNAIKNIAPMVLQGLTYIGKIILGYIVEYGPVLLNQLGTWAMAFLDWIAPVAAMMITRLLELGARIINWIASHAAAITREIFQWVTSFVSWVAPAITQILTNLLELGAKLIIWIAGYAPVILNQLFYWTTAFAAWIAPAIPLILNALAGLLKEVVAYIISSVPQILNAFDSLTSSLGIRISGPIQLVSNLFSNVLVPAFMLAVRFIFDNFIPALNLVASSIFTNIVPALQGLVASIYNNLVPVFDVLAKTIASTILPVLGFLIGVISNVLIPAFARIAIVVLQEVIPPLATFVMHVTSILIPVFNAVVNTIANTLIPALLFAGTTLSLVFGPAFRTVAGIISTEFLPWIDASWQRLDQKFGPAVKDAAGKLGNEFAVKIQEASSRLKDMLPNVEGMAEKLAPFAKKALEVVEALSPLSTAIAVLGGLLSGGPAGAVDSFKERLDKLKTVTGIDLVGAFNTVKGFIEGTLIPIFKNIVSFIETNVIPGFQNLANIFTNVVIPAVGKVWDWFNTYIIPIFASLVDTFNNTVLPALRRFGDFISDKVIPTLSVLFAWVGEKVVPVIQTLANVWTNQVIPVLGAVIAFILDKIIPTLFAWWQVIATFLRPIIEAIAFVITNVLAPAFAWVVDYIVKNVIPNMSALADNIRIYVMPVLARVADIMGGAIVGAFNLLSLGVSMVISVFTTMGDIIGKIISGIGATIGWLYNSVVMPVFNAIGTALATVGGFFQGLWTTIVNVWNGISSFLGNAAKGFGNIFVGALNAVLGVVNGIIGAINGAIQWGKSLPWPASAALDGVGYMSYLPMIQYFARGTNNAPGGMSVLGEAGAEMLRLPGGRSMLVNGATLFPNLPAGSQVIPLTGPYAQQGGNNPLGGITVNGGINVTLTAPAGSDATTMGQQIAQAVRDELMKTGGGLQINRNYGIRGIA